MKNIMSLDIDFFFTEMNIYQKYMDTELTPKQSWQLIKWKAVKNKEKLHFEPCNLALEYVKNILLSKCKGVKRIALIQEHDEIIKVLEKEGCSEANLYNFDYHEDVSYQENIEEDTELTLENWIQFARKKNLVKRIAWIGQDDSRKVHQTLIKIDSTSWKDYDWWNFPDFDVLVICVSKHFTPPKYWKLAKELKEFAEGVE